MYLRRLETHTEGGEHEDGHEQDLPGVSLQEAAEDEQLLLQPGADPQ